jgi:CHAD domain-containing protein
MASREIEQARAALAGSRPAGASARRPGASAGVVARVHDARTALKKVRALARLVAPVIGRAARDAERELRDVGRALSVVRDAEVLVDTFEGVRRSSGVRAGRELAAARKTLDKRLKEHLGALAGARQRSLAARLSRAQRQVTGWLPDDDRWRTLGPGLVNQYRRGRKRMAKAYARETSHAFHAWRRAAKTLRHQMQALEPLWPAELDAQRAALERLGDLLGEEHDLAVLAETLREERLFLGDDPACRQFLAAIEKRQHELRAEARPLGDRLYAETPTSWARRVRAYFRAFRREEPGIAAEAVARPPTG